MKHLFWFALRSESNAFASNSSSPFNRRTKIQANEQRHFFVLNDSRESFIAKSSIYSRSRPLANRCVTQFIQRDGDENAQETNTQLDSDRRKMWSAIQWFSHSKLRRKNKETFFYLCFVIFVVIMWHRVGSSLLCQKGRQLRVCRSNNFFPLNLYHLEL